MAVTSQVGWRLLLMVGGGCVVLGLLFGTKGFAQTETLPAAIAVIRRNFI